MITRRNKLVITRNDIVEWFANGEAGIEEVEIEDARKGYEVTLCGNLAKFITDSGNKLKSWKMNGSFTRATKLIKCEGTPINL